MNIIEPSFWALFTAGIAFIAGIFVAIKVKSLSSAPCISNPSTAPEPRVIVNVPADFKMPEALPPTQIEGARAQLWYAVYKASLDAINEGGDYVSQGDMGEARHNANEAVDKVFGAL